MVANSDNTDKIFLWELSNLDYHFALTLLNLKSLNQI